MGRKKLARPVVPLTRIGPTDPVVRSYVTDVGTLTVNYSQLERHIRGMIRTLEGFEQQNLLTLPSKFHQVRAQTGKRNLGRVIEEVKALGIDPKLAMALGQTNADRISVIHEAAKLVDDVTLNLDYPGIRREQVRLRRVLKGVRSTYTGILEAEYEVFEQFLGTAEARLGTSHQSLIPVRDKLRQLKVQLDHNRALNPSP